MLQNCLKKNILLMKILQKLQTINIKAILSVICKKLQVDKTLKFI